MVKFDPKLHFRTLEELNAALLVPRQEECVQCEDGAPRCSQCPEGEMCSFTAPSCDSCAQAVCIEDDSVPDEDDSSGGPNVGAIVGGVLGGVIAVAIATYLVWRFCIKPKRQQSSGITYVESIDRVGSEKEADAPRDKRSSVHTVHSIASTVLTRASNIIQIAYIPGVTNRATPSSPGVLVPPVPPIPMHVSSAATTPSYTEDQHFFTPGELRDSTYSGLSRDSDRTSYARSSYAPRASMAPSIASTIYGKNAVVVAPAQTGMRAKAAMVSVKSMGGGSADNESIPAVPSIDYDKYDTSKARDSTFSVGSTFLNNANTATATPARAQVVRLGSGSQVKQVSVGSKSEAGSSKLASPSTSVRGSPLATRAPSTTAVEEGPFSDQGPFSDPPPSSSGGNQSPTESLSAAAIEEATKRAARGPDRKSKLQSEALSQERSTSPFGDEHATKE